MSKKARNRKSLNRCINRLAKSVAKVFEPSIVNPLNFLDTKLVKEIKEYEWKIMKNK